MTPSAVFVDPSGRRARWFFRACSAVGAVMCVYVGLVVLSLVAPPGVTRLGLGPLLPRLVAPKLAGPGGVSKAPVEVLDQTPGASPYPQPATTHGTSRSPGPTPPGRSSATPKASKTASPRSTATGSPSGSTSPKPKPTTRSTAHPTPKASRTPPPHP